jgi:hypothetical protein
MRFQIFVFREFCATKNAADSSRDGFQDVQRIRNPAQFDRFPDRRPVRVCPMPRKRGACRLFSARKTGPNSNLVRPDAVGFQSRTRANLFWQARASLANEVWDIELDPLLRGMRK